MAKSCGSTTTVRCHRTTRSWTAKAIGRRSTPWDTATRWVSCSTRRRGRCGSHENGPNGGDEINILAPGRNYGWPVVSFGRNYSGDRITEHPTREGMESPFVVWLPAIAVAGMAVYTGDRFPAWTDNVFVGSLRQGGIPGTGHLQRIVFNERTEELRRESILTELRQRIREVREGPDGFLYLLTDEDDGALLRIEPAP